MSGADRADLPKSPPDFRILRGKTNEFMIRIYEATDPSDLLAEAFARLLPQLSERMTAPDREAVARGIGEALVREALALARREGVARVMLTSNATRRASHRLYERMGFVRYETDCFRLDL